MRTIYYFWMVFGFVGTLAFAGETRPNIVFIFADDMGRYASAYAEVDPHPSMNQVVKTPNMDRIAKQGVLFKNAFVNSPSCTPCRSALLTGRYFFNTGLGAILRGAQWDASIPSFPLLMRDAGYHIGKTFKVWSPGTPAHAPFGGNKYAYEQAGNKFNNFSKNVTNLVSEGTELNAAKQKMYDEVRANFDAFLAARPNKTPFLYWFGPTNTHRQWVKGSGKALWNIEPDSLKGKLPPFLPDVPEVRQDMADYLGEVQAVDAAIGVLVKQLETAGELENTILVVSGDHGVPGVPGGKCNLYDFGTKVSLMIHWPGQPGGRVVDDFVNLMDLTPTFLEMGGTPLPAGLNGRSLTSVLKTDKSGWVDAERNYVVTGRERHVHIAREGNLPYPHRALRTADFLYIRNFKPERWPMGEPRNLSENNSPDKVKLESDSYTVFPDMDASPTKAWVVLNRNVAEWNWIYNYAFGLRPEEELYDLKNDPHQIRNLASQTDHAAKKKEMSDRLMKILQEAGDPRLKDDAFDKDPYLNAGISKEDAPGKKKK